jgi:hypothetical protein
MEKDIYGPTATPIKKAKGGTASARADGIAQRGKTQAKQIAMKCGGKVKNQCANWPAPAYFPALVALAGIAGAGFGGAEQWHEPLVQRWGADLLEADGFRTDRG